MQLLRTILIIIIVYYLIKLVMRYVLPLWARYFIKKTQEKMEKQYREPQKKEGEISIDYAPEKKKPSDELGDYIDYEDIKED